MNVRRVNRNTELADVRRAGRHLQQRAAIAIKLIETALIAHGATRHPLIDTLLDVRNALRSPQDDPSTQT